MKSARRFINRKHRIKWAALGGMLGSGTTLLQYIPQSWPTWLGVSLTLAAFAVAGVSHFLEPED